MGKILSLITASSRMCLRDQGLSLGVTPSASFRHSLKLGGILRAEHSSYQ